ncbi:hypothetical protein SAMN05443245_6168 [Paraburkholderia fungorum]|uniref:Uncharacterized protein n=1 Tax=Paraburkholderia fungorum TaxID=134537 RepID=A0A1H1JF41_9BURK|nr:hypothetical protein [Paraburkholderia fungorum]SDR48246.1 hypothetical protein SAMN05443245_6168 [Paraburkholderia fungorum]
MRQAELVTLNMRELDRLKMVQPYSAEHLPLIHPQTQSVYLFIAWMPRRHLTRI